MFKQVSPLNLTQLNTVQFQGKEPETISGSEAFRDKIRKTSDQHQDVFLKKPNEQPPDKKISQAKKNSAKGLGLALVALLGAFGSVTGARSLSDYQDERTEVSHVAGLNDKIETSWLEVRDTANTIEKTNAYDNPELVGRYNDRMNGFIIKLTQTMKEVTGDSAEVQGLDQELINELDKNTDFMPHRNAQQVALEFTHFMEQELQSEYGVTPEKALTSQIDTINIERFLNEHPAFRDLSLNEKTELAEELSQTYSDKRTFPTPTYFTDAINGAIDTGIAGASIEEFAVLTHENNVATEAEAIVLFENIVENNENFAHLSDSQRKAIVERGTEILESLEYDSPSAMWGLGAFSLMSVSALGGLGILIARRKDLINALHAPVDLYKGLAQPVLVIEATNEAGNPEAKRHLSVLNNEINHYAKEIERVIEQTYHNNPEAADILGEMYPKGNLPKAASIVQQYVYNTKVELIANRSLSEKLAEKPIAELAFAQKVLEALGNAYDTGSYMQLGLPAGMINPEKETQLTEAHTPVERLQVEQRKLEHQMKEARKFLVNQMFTVTQAKQQLASANKTLENLKIDITNGSDEEGLSSRLMDIEAKKKLAEKHVDSVNQVQQAAKTQLGQKIIQLQNYHRQLSKLIHSDRMAGELEQLNQLVDNSKAQLEDPSLQRLVDEVELEVYMKQTANDEAAATQQFEALLADTA